MNWLEEWEVEHAKEAKAAWDRANTPEAIAAREAKQVAEFERGVRNGWWDAEGNPIPTFEETDDDDDGED